MGRKNRFKQPVLPQAAQLPPARRTKFNASGGYDAVVSKNKRKAPSGILRSEDAELGPAERKKAISAARDIHRNYAVAAWMVRRHLDHVSTFSFRAKTGDPALDDKLEGLVRWWSQPYNFEVTRRHSLQSFIRLAEMRRVLDGDMGVIKLANGYVQAVEGDRIRTPVGGIPEGYSAADFVHGVRHNSYGRPVQFCICKRGKTSDAGGQPSTFEFERLVSASNLYHFYYTDRFDQVRGISPLVTAVNTLRDTYEGFDYALAKMKVAQLFGIVFTRQDSGAVLPVTVEDEGEDADDNGSRYTVNPAAGPMSLELDPGDDVKTVESSTPSNEFQAFSQTMIAVALKALDIPYSFYAENFTNYSGARQALMLYQKSTKPKQAECQALLNHLLKWRINLWIQDGYLPPVTLYENHWDWVPGAIPWIDPVKEAAAHKELLALNLTSPQRICRENGEDWYEIADELAEAAEYLKSLGINQTPAAPAASLPPDADADKEAEEDKLPPQ